MIDGRTDIYALGCVFYEMLAGQPPFTGKSTQEILARHAREPVLSLPTAGGAIAPAVESRRSGSTPSCPQIGSRVQPSLEVPSPEPKNLRGKARGGGARAAGFSALECSQ